MTSKIAWAAGIIDGEGFVGFTKNRNSKRPMADVSNTDTRILYELQKYFGGKIYEQRRTTHPRPNHKPCWVWRLAGRKVCPFLEMIEPYLISRRDKALEILNYYKK